jgi:hypothetical protein
MFRCLPTFHALREITVEGRGRALATPHGLFSRWSFSGVQVVGPRFSGMPLARAKALCAILGS